LACERVGPWFLIRPTSSPNPSRPPLIPLVFFSRPPLLSLGRRPLPSPISFFLKPLQPPPHKTLAAPHPPLSKVQPSPLGSPSYGCELSIGVWKGEEGRRKGRTQGEFVIIFCCLCAAIKLIICLPMRIGRGAVQKFCGWANSSSSSDFWEFFVGN
jgi:hypothetical protein